MALTLDDLISSLEESRQFFLKHIDGLTDEQWEWKPYPECKNVRETIAHLVADELTFVESLESGEEPDYTKYQRLHEQPREDLLRQLEEAYRARIATIRERYGSSSMDEEICVWGWKKKLAPGLLFFSGEDFYHAGQVAYIRMATDPSWDYYMAIFGGG